VRRRRPARLIAGNAPIAADSTALTGDGVLGGLGPQVDALEEQLPDAAEPFLSGQVGADASHCRCQPCQTRRRFVGGRTVQVGVSGGVGSSVDDLLDWDLLIPA
jgi:hypothetical protein